MAGWGLRGWRVAVALYLGASGSYAAALAMQRQILRAWEGTGAPSTPPLTARGNLAYWTGEAGDLAGAWDQFAALVPVIERVLGAEHPDTLTDRASLAYWARLARNPE